MTTGLAGGNAAEPRTVEAEAPLERRGAHCTPTRLRDWWVDFCNHKGTEGECRVAALHRERRKLSFAILRDWAASRCKDRHELQVAKPH